MSWKAQISLAFFAQLLVIACLNMSDPYWPLILHHLNQSIAPSQVQYWSAAVLMVPFAFTIIATPIWTHLGDRFGHKKMLLRAGFVLALTQVLTGLTAQPWAILAIRLLQGVFAGFTAAASAWAISISRSPTHNHVLGRMQAATAVGAIVGPLFGGVVAHYWGYHAIFFSSGVACALMMLVLTNFLIESPPRRAKLAGSERQGPPKKGLYYVLFLICFTQGARWMSASYFALYVTHRLGGSNLTVGMLYALIALAIFISAPRWGILVDQQISNLRRVKVIFMLTLLGASLTQYLFAASTQLWLAVVAALLWGVCLGAISLIPFTLLIKESGQEVKGHLIGLGASASKLGNLIGVAAGASIQAASNFTWSFIAIGLIYGILGALLGILLLQSSRAEYAETLYSNAWLPNE